MTFISSYPRFVFEWIAQQPKCTKSKATTVATPKPQVKFPSSLKFLYSSVLSASAVVIFFLPPLLYSIDEETMTLSDQIQKDLTDAMRSKDELRLSVLRGIKSAIKYKETEKIRALDEPESIQLLQTLVKQRKESIDQFQKGNRPDLVEKETKELAIIESYLPAGATEAEMDAAIAKAIAETSAASIKQMGAVVKAAKAALEGKTVDGKALSDRVRARLS
jgi:uncharacterized protein